MTDTCRQCGNEYTRIAGHWSASKECDYRSFSQYQKELITGLLMGDGWIDRSGSNPTIRSEMITPEYLNYIDKKLDIFGNGVSLRMKAEESAKENRETGFSKNAKKENYSDIYEWHSMRHPELNEFEEWYSTGQKTWPEKVKLTPVVLKHWYCGDGNFDNSNSQRHITIYMSNELENKDKVTKMFENKNLPTPTYYTSKRGKNYSRCDARFTVQESQELFEYMGKPLPGFDYKWPKKYRNS